MKGHERPQATKPNRYRPKPVWPRPADSPRKPYPVGRLPKAKRGPTQGEGSFTQSEGSFTQSEASFTLGPAF